MTEHEADERRTFEPRPIAGEAALRRKVAAQLKALHALKSAALRMFDAMLSAVRAERAASSLAEVEDLLGRMLDAFGGHREETAAHERGLRRRLSELGERPSAPREIGMGLAALARGNLGRIGGQNQGANARDAFVFEHLEIASYELLERLAERAGDLATAELARSARVEDAAMADKIARNWDNVLSLMLASEQIPTNRPDQSPVAETPPAPASS
ncbi:MAG: DUF892 family protein [Thermoleophilaceae bacterium]|nr:DUF892 family protein [Thermoleophilaceae bacterium]